MRTAPSTATASRWRSPTPTATRWQQLGQTADAWSISAEFDHHFTPEFTVSLEGSYGGVNWTNTDADSMVSNSTTWLVGVVAHWDPVKNLDFEFELLYQNTHNSTAERLRRRHGPPGRTNVSTATRTASRLASKSPAAGNFQLDQTREPRSESSGVLRSGRFALSDAEGGGVSGVRRGASASRKGLISAS